AGETELALQLVAAQWRYWQLDGHLNVGRDLTNAALAMPGADAPTAARLAAIAAAGGIAYWRSESELADQLYRKQLALAEQLGDDRAAADASFNLIFTRYIGGDIEDALATIAESERRFRLLGDERGLARIEWTRGTIALQAGDLPGAIEIMERSLARFAATGDAWYHATAAGSLTYANWSAGNKPVAYQWFLTALAETLAMRDIASITIGLPMSAVLALDNRGPEVAATLMGAFENLRQLHGIEPPAGLNYLIETNKPIERARVMLGDEAFEAAFDRGRRMSLDEAVALVAGDSKTSRSIWERRAAGSQ
ncbi:MAG TPA: hypothetical protein VF494_08425, partial [Candidatus Limnocylindrales bacterium]